MNEDIVLGSFGVAAAVLLVGGSVLIRWQRNRQQFLLMQTALLQGLRSFPVGPPAWVATMRQGVTTLGLGLGLIVVGAIAYVLGARVPAPTAQELAQMQAAPPQQRPANQQPPPRAQRPPLRNDGRPGEPPPRELGGPLDGPPGENGARQGDPRQADPRQPDPREIAQREGAPAENGQRGPRLMPSPAAERWHFAQSEQTVGLLAIGSGIVLTLLGLVHVGFSGVERRHTPITLPVDPSIP